MNDKPPLMQFTSHINGRNAKVEIHGDRVEWAKPSTLMRKGGTEMIPVKAITSVATRKHGLMYWEVTIITSGATIDMRVSKAEATQIKDTLQRLILA